LREVPITIDILRETKIGNTVYEAKKKYPAGSKCHNESKDIIALWKKSCDVQVNPIKPSSTSGAANDDEAKVKPSEKSEKASPTIAHSDSVDNDDDGEVERNYDSLSQTRRKVTSLLQTLM
jgi:TFIIS helical bundle-like domain